MKTAKIIALSILAVLIFHPAFAMQEQTSDTHALRNASCVIRITMDKKESLPSEEILNYVRSILQSSGVSLEAAEKFMDLKNRTLNGIYSSRQSIDELINISLISQQLAGNDASYNFKLIISDGDMGGNNANAPVFMKVIVDGLKKELNKSYEDYVKRIGYEVKKAEENAKDAEKEFYALQEQMRKISGKSDLSRRKLLADINNLQGRIDDLQIDIEQRTAEISNLSRQVDNIRMKIQDRLQNDAVLNSLESMVKDAQKQRDSVKQLADVGATSQQDLYVAEEKLTKAKLEVTRRQDELQRPTGRDSIDYVNEQIASSSARINFDKKLIATYYNQSDTARKNLEKSDEYEVLSIKSDIAKASLRQALQALEDLKRNTDIVPPTITVLGD